MVNGLIMLRQAHLVASVTSARPARRSAPMARLRRLAMTRGPLRAELSGLNPACGVSRSPVRPLTCADTCT